MRLRVDGPDGERKSLEQRLFEAYQDCNGMRLSQADVAHLIEGGHMAARITDIAMVEANHYPPTNAEGIIRPPIPSPETWDEFKRRAINTRRPWLRIRHEVVSSRSGMSPPHLIHIEPEAGGIGIRPQGTGLCECQEDEGGPVYVGFCTDGTPEVIVWPDINNPDGTMISLADASETERRPEQPSD